jgi:hypothetical protein
MTAGKTVVGTHVTGKKDPGTGQSFVKVEFVFNFLERKVQDA